MPVMTNKEADADETAADDDLLIETDDDLLIETDDESVESGAVLAQSGSTPGAVRGLLFPALVGALIAALAGAGFFGWKFWQQHQLDQAKQAAQRTAVAYAQVLTSVDSNNVDENFKQVLDGATGEFKDMYSKSSVELRQLLIENKATAHGVVVESAVQEASKDRAVVLLFVDQSVTNTKLPDPRIDRSRMKMTLEKVDGSWRASKVELP